MASFDIVNKINIEAFKNSINAVNRETSTRYDFKGSDSKIEEKENDFYIIADSDLKLKQIKEILSNHLVRQNVSTKSISFGSEEKASGNKIKQNIIIHDGISKEIAQDLIKKLKSQKLKIQSSIQGDQVRVTGKKRDDLQVAINFIKGLDLSIPVSFINFRDWNYLLRSINIFSLSFNPSSCRLINNNSNIVIK